MVNFKKFIGSRSGNVVMSIILGLGLASIFKMSCDHRSCIIYNSPDFSEKKIMKYNDKCFKPTEQMEKCDSNKIIIDN
jgi:hypothetical protein